MSSRAIPYRAREPSAVAVFIDSTRLAMRRTTIRFDAPPTSSSKTGT
jgi:hypothetical protein